MVLNGSGFSNPHLYLVPLVFTYKPVEYILEPGITAEMLDDHCLGCTLDWLYAPDLMKLFAGIATHARRVFSITAAQMHVDMSSTQIGANKEPLADHDLWQIDRMTAAASPHVVGVGHNN